jgi:hypothetical protein
MKFILSFRAAKFKRCARAKTLIRTKRVQSVASAQNDSQDWRGMLQACHHDALYQRFNGMDFLALAQV